jgi:hypothetical protein
VLAKADMIANKTAVGRPKDRAARHRSPKPTASIAEARTGPVHRIIPAGQDGGTTAIA